MKKLTTLGGALAVAAFALTSAQAKTSVDSKNADVQVIIAGVNTISLAIKNMDHTPATGIGFLDKSGLPVDPGGSTWTAKGTQYIQLSVNDNINTGWELRNYTDNFNFAGGVLPSTTVWGYQYGGLKGTVPGQRAGVGWMVLPDTGVVTFGGPDAADPAFSGTNGWTYLKDRSDQDPTTLGGPQSFDGSGGYPNVAFGGLTETRIVRPNEGGSKVLAAGKTAPFYYFLGADFKGVAPGTYSATITFELMNL